MKLKPLFTAVAAAAMLAFAMPAMAEDDPGPAAYAAALNGKRVALVPMAMGFDLAQGWASYLKREVEGWGGVFETRDPNWSIEAGASYYDGVARGEADVVTDDYRVLTGEEPLPIRAILERVRERLPLGSR